MDKPKEEKRAPLLSDTDLAGPYAPGVWPPNSVSAVQVFPRIPMTAEGVRDFYEAKITSGELMVVKTAHNVEGKAWTLWCSACNASHDQTPEKPMNFCPGCGAKIVP